MPNIDLLKDNRDIEGITSFFVSCLPQGYLYESDSIRDFVKGFVGVYRDSMLKLEKSINDLFFLKEDGFFLKEYLVMYGLPNTIFPDITTNQEAVFSISMMKLSQTLISQEDFENFMALLGIKVKFYNLNVETIDHQTFNYAFPITFSNSISFKDKLTYWIYVEEDDTSNQGNDNYNNLGDAFEVDFISSSNNLQKANKILDYLKPDYLIFKYITLYTKNLYGL